jgi:actin-related protein
LSGDNIEEHPPDGDLRQRYLHRMEPTSDEEKGTEEEEVAYYTPVTEEKKEEEDVSPVQKEKVPMRKKRLERKIKSNEKKVLNLREISNQLEKQTMQIARIESTVSPLQKYLKNADKQFTMVKDLHTFLRKLQKL